MSNAVKRWHAHPGRGADGVLRLDGPRGTATIGAIEDGADGTLHVWTGPHQDGPAPLRILDPLDSDPTTVVVELVGGAVEEGR